MFQTIVLPFLFDAYEPSFVANVGVQPPRYGVIWDDLLERAASMCSNFAMKSRPAAIIVTAAWMAAYVAPCPSEKKALMLSRSRVAQIIFRFVSSVISPIKAIFLAPSSVAMSTAKSLWVSKTVNIISFEIISLQFLESSSNHEPNIGYVIAAMSKNRSPTPSQ